MSGVFLLFPDGACCSGKERAVVRVSSSPVKKRGKEKKRSEVFVGAQRKRRVWGGEGRAGRV